MKKIREYTCPNNSVYHITKTHEINAGIFDEAKQNTFKNTPQFGMGLAVCKELDDLFVFLLFSVKYRIFASD